MLDGNDLETNSSINLEDFLNDLEVEEEKKDIDKDEQSLVSQEIQRTQNKDEVAIEKSQEDVDILTELENFDDLTIGGKDISINDNDSVKIDNALKVSDLDKNDQSNVEDFVVADSIDIFDEANLKSLDDIKKSNKKEEQVFSPKELIEFDLADINIKNGNLISSENTDNSEVSDEYSILEDSFDSTEEYEDLEKEDKEESSQTSSVNDLFGEDEDNLDNKPENLEKNLEVFAQREEEQSSSFPSLIDDNVSKTDKNEEVLLKEDEKIESPLNVEKTQNFCLIEKYGEEQPERIETESFSSPKLISSCELNENEILYFIQYDDFYALMGNKNGNISFLVKFDNLINDIIKTRLIEINDYKKTYIVKTNKRKFLIEVTNESINFLLEI